MTANATAVRPARVSAAKQPPANSVWIRYHPWIEGLTAHVSAWSIHLLIIGGAVLWFWYLANALGVTQPLRSLPVTPVRLEQASREASAQEAGTKNNGERAARIEDSGNSIPDKSKPTDPGDRPDLTPVKPTVTVPDFARPGDRTTHQDMGPLDKLARMTDDVQNKLQIGLGNRNGDSGTATDDGNGPGPGTGSQHVLDPRQRRMLRWSIKFTTRDPKDYLRQLQALGSVVAVPNGPASFEIVDLAKQPFKPEVKDLSTIQKIWWIDNDAKSVQGLLEALRLPAHADLIIAFIPKEVEEELAKKELAYRGLDENAIFETTFGIEVPGAGGRKYDLRVLDQKRKTK